MMSKRYCADIVSTQIKNDEVILKGEIPARCIQEYRNDLTYFWKWAGSLLEAELKDTSQLLVSCCSAPE